MSSSCLPHQIIVTINLSFFSYYFSLFLNFELPSVRATETTPSDSACDKAGTNKGHQKVNNKKESKEMNKKDDCIKK